MSATFQAIRPDQLRGADPTKLGILWRDGVCPTGDELDGDYYGEILWLHSVHSISTRLGNLLSGIVGLGWRGKSFVRPERPGEKGRGYNLLRGISLPLRPMPFSTQIQQSRALDGECLVLDYDLPGNGTIRSLRDEIRSVGIGLYLGLMLKVGSSDADLGFFLLQR